MEAAKEARVPGPLIPRYVFLPPDPRAAVPRVGSELRGTDPAFPGQHPARIDERGCTVPVPANHSPRRPHTPPRGPGAPQHPALILTTFDRSRGGGGGTFPARPSIPARDAASGGTAQGLPAPLPPWVGAPRRSESRRKGAPGTPRGGAAAEPLPKPAAPDPLCPLSRHAHTRAGRVREFGVQPPRTPREAKARKPRSRRAGSPRAGRGAGTGSGVRVRGC